VRTKEHSMRKLNILTTEKFPYLFTLLIALISFHLNYLVSEVSNTPSVEYFLTTELINPVDSILNEYQHVCIITNISKNTTFNNLIFNFEIDATEHKDYIFDDSIITVPPASNRDSENFSIKRLAEFKIKHLLPGFRYEFRFKTISMENNKPKLFITSGQTLRLLNKSLRTWITKNNFLINLLALSFWFLIIVMYIIYINIKSETK
jgi:hypothetical protein